MTRKVLALSLQKTSTYSDLIKLLSQVCRIRDEISHLSQRNDVCYPILVLTLGKISRIKDEIILLKDRYDGYIVCEAEVKDNLIVLKEEVSKTCGCFIALIFS